MRCCRTRLSRSMRSQILFLPTPPSTHVRTLKSFRLAEKRMTAASGSRLAAPRAMRHDRANRNGVPQAMRRGRGGLYEAISYQRFGLRAGDVTPRGAGAGQAAAQAR